MHFSKQFAFFVALFAIVLPLSNGGPDRGSKHRNKRSNFRLNRPSSHRKNELNNIEVGEREENIDVEEREKERERGSNLRRQRLASPTAQVLVAQTTQPVQKNRLRDDLSGCVRTDTVDWGVGRREKEGKETSGRGSQDEPAQAKEENGS